MGDYMKKILLLFIVSFILIYPTFSTSIKYNYNKKNIAITFDDGPSIYTNDIINYLYENGCTGTFFVLGNKALKNQNTLLNAINKGNEIANHTYSHPWLTHLSDEEIIEEINKTQDIIKNITGNRATLFRPSYGDINKKIKKMINLRIVFWTNDSRDWKYKSAKTIASNVIRNIKDNDIILMHDTHKRTLDALKIIVPKLKELGYEIITVSELLRIREYHEFSIY